jgi:hypothetical protein
VLDPWTGTVQSVLDTGIFQDNFRLMVDSTTGVVVVHNPTEYGHAYPLFMYDNGYLTSIMDDDVKDVYIDSKRNLIYVILLHSDVTLVFDEWTGAMLGALSMPSVPELLYVDETSGDVYVMGNYDNLYWRVYRIDYLLQSINLIYSSPDDIGEVRNPTYDTYHGRIYFNTQNVIFGYDIATNTVNYIAASYSNDQNIQNMVFDPVKQAIYMLCTDSLQVYDFTTDQVTIIADLAPYEGAFGIDVNPADHILYFIVRNPVPRVIAYDTDNWHEIFNVAVGNEASSYLDVKLGMQCDAWG